MNLKCYIDNREQNRVKSAQFYYKKQGLETEVQELEVGDYIFTDGTDNVVFEFKTVADFVSSIQNNRVFNQAISQAEEFNYHYVIIQGDESTRTKCLAMSKNYRRVTVYQYVGAIASLNRYTTVIESYSPFLDEAYYRMLVTARKCLQNRPIVKKFTKKEKNAALNFLCHDIYGINYKRAKLITDTYNLKSLGDLMTLNIDKLKEIDGIGENTAKKIYEAIR